MVTDLQRLIEKYRKEIAQLEAQVEEMKHRQDVLVEASEALTPYSTLEEASEALDMFFAHRARTDPDLQCRRGSFKGSYRLRQRTQCRLLLN